MKPSTTKVFLDLEDTVITVWNDPYLKNTRKVREYLTTIPQFDGTVAIFSFAIYNTYDQGVFEQTMKQWLEDALGVSITEWPSVQDVAKASQRLTGVRWFDGDVMNRVDVNEFISIKGKAGAFEDFCLDGHKKGDNTHFVLIDDVVPNKTMIYHNRGLVIDLVNVDLLP